MKLIVIISCLIFISFSYANGIESDEVCNNGYYIKFEKRNESYVVNKVSKTYIDEGNVLYFSIYNNSESKTSKFDIIKPSKYYTCSRLYSNKDNKAACNGDFISNSINEKEHYATKTVSSFGLFPLVDFAVLGVGVTPRVNESNVDLAQKNFDYTKYSEIEKDILACRLFKSKYGNTVTVELYKNNLSKKVFRENLEVGNLTTCGKITKIRGNKYLVKEYESDVGIWLKQEDLFPLDDLRQKDIGCRIESNLYKKI